MSETLSMRTRGPVAIGVDGSEDSERALRFGVDEALRQHCDVRVVHVAHETVPVAPMLPLFSVATLDDIGWKVLDDAASRVKELSGGELTVQSVLVHAPRVTGILDHSVDAHCIVLGTRSPSIYRVVTGATSNGVAARATCPVICVPHAGSAEAHGRVVAGVDGSPTSSVVLGAAFAAAHARHADLTVLHAWRPARPYDVAMGRGGVAREWKERAHRDVSERVAGWSRRFPDVDVALCMRYERPAVALVETTDHADLLVIGRHGHSGPVGFSLGSTTRALIRTAHCPVQVVPDPC